ncbi:MAG: hypothetical protein ABF629_11210 [Sporolactobacillus sp.]
MVIVGFGLIGGGLGLLVGVVWLVIGLILHRRVLKANWLMLGGALALIVVSLGIGMALPSADYTVSDAAEGRTFIKQLNEGADVTDKTLEVTVEAVGSSNEMGVGLGAPGGFSIALPNSQATRHIKVGDEVTVTCTQARQFFGLWIVTGRLEGQ